MSERIVGHIDLIKDYVAVRVPKDFRDRMVAEGVGQLVVRIDDAERCMVIRPVDVADIKEET